MRTIEWTSTFQHDYKRVSASPRHRDIETILPEIVSLLVKDKPLKNRNRDHSPGGGWKRHRECHLKPDLLLIDKKPSPEVLRLVRLGSHSELFSR